MHLHLHHILRRTVHLILRLIRELHIHQLSHDQQTVIQLPKLLRLQLPFLQLCQIELMFLLEEIYPETANLQRSLHIKKGGSVVTCKFIYSS